jgi:hypothetical protein
LNEIDHSSYDALLPAYPWNDFSQDELKAIENYVENGGGLLLPSTPRCIMLEGRRTKLLNYSESTSMETFMDCSIVDFDHPITMDKSQSDLFNPFLPYDAAIDRYPSDAVIPVKAGSTPSNAPNGTNTASPTTESSTTGGISMVARAIVLTVGVIVALLITGRYKPS